MLPVPSSLKAVYDPSRKFSAHWLEAMFKIFDVLRRVGFLRVASKDTKIGGTTAVKSSDRRSTSRTFIQIPLFVYGYAPGGDPFYEEACTISINGHGGLVSMAGKVKPGQWLVVTNEGNDQTQVCVVVSVRARFAHERYIALKFLTPKPQFWRQLEIGKSPVQSDRSTAAISGGND